MRVLIVQPYFSSDSILSIDTTPIEELEGGEEVEGVERSKER